MKATWNGAILAESDQTVVVEGNHYFPRNTVDDRFLVPSDHQSVCPWKGTASYFHVKVDSRINADAAWVYASTSEKARNIEGYIAFWHGVEVTE